jgi:hypothetical protein
MAWDIPDFTLKGQPQISESWADGIASARKDKLARDETDALKLGRQQAVSSAYDADGRFDGGKAADFLMKRGDFDGARAVSGFGAPARPAPTQAAHVPMTVPNPQPRPENLSPSGRLQYNSMTGGFD